MVEEVPETEHNYLDREIQDLCLEFMKFRKSIAVGIATYEGEVLISPLTGYGPKRFARVLAPLAKKCRSVGLCLEPMAKPLSFSIWTRRMTYTVLFAKNVFGFAVQEAIRLPAIPPKPMEEISETERNEKRDKEIRLIKRLREEKAKAKAEAEKKAKEREERKKRMKALARLKKIKKPPTEKKGEVAEAGKEEGEAAREREEGEKEERESGEEEGEEEEEEEAEDEEFGEEQEQVGEEQEGGEGGGGGGDD